MAPRLAPASPLPGGLSLFAVASSSTAVESAGIAGAVRGEAAVGVAFGRRRYPARLSPSAPPAVQAPPAATPRGAATRTAAALLP